MKLVGGLTEKEIQGDVKKALALLGFKVFDTSQPFRAAITPGVSDLIVAGRGVVAFMEVKSATGQQSPAQENFQASVEANGGRYVLVRSAADVVRWVEGLPKRSAFEVLGD